MQAIVPFRAKIASACDLEKNLLWFLVTIASVELV
jgi:hypothetical protein